MERSESINELATALSKAQGVMPNAKKDSENPFFHSKYADLTSVIDAAKKPLADNGLSILQLTSSDGDFVRVQTILLHLSGQWIGETLALHPVKTDPQGLGSAITYGRRYSYSAIIGMASEEDDDGNAASHPEVKAPAERRKPATLLDKAKLAIDSAMFTTDLCVILVKAREKFKGDELIDLERLIADKKHTLETKQLEKQ
jgi:hypothetical protein